MPAAVDVHLYYPPLAYPYMPYLAPYLLKGFLESAGRYRVTTHDLNIECHHHLWSGEIGRRMAASFRDRGDRANMLLAEAVAEHGAAAAAALRDESTYADREAVRACALLLREARTLVSRHDDGPAILPRACGAWPRLVEHILRSSTVGRYLRDVVESGACDSAEVAGISIAYVDQLAYGLALAHLLKRRRPDVPVILGGNAVTHFLPEIQKDESFWTAVDYAIPYEGEHDLLQLLEALSGRGPMPEYNVLYATPGGIHYRKDLSRRANVVATADFSAMPHRYPTPHPILPLLLSKGCYWGKCAFCTHHEGYGQGYRAVSSGGVTDAIERARAQGGKYFYFVDEALPPRVLRSIAAAFRDADAGAGGWMAEARVEKQFEEGPAVALLAESGCRMLVNGLESGCQRVVDRMQKNIDLARAARFAAECAQVGIRTAWMFFVGFPGETREEAEETFRFIEANARSVDFCSCGHFTLERGSPIWNDPARWDVARVLDAEADYPLGFDYEMAGGERVTRGGLRALRDDLLAGHGHLAPLFTGAIDRALAMFLPPRLEEQQPEAGSSASARFTWRSAAAGVRAEADLASRRITLHHEQ